MAERILIRTSDLRKSYDGVDALRGLDLEVAAGSICGFLGRNGAGKTTTMKILLGMVRPTSGEARVFDLPAASAKASVEIRGRTGFVSEDKDLYGFMTVEEMIRFTAAMFLRWRADLQQQYLRKFDLPLHRKVKALSRGMRTKLTLLLVLCRGAELLILDEPASGLDPVMAEEILQALVSHVAAGETTIFFSSNQVSEVDQIADRIVVIDRGRAVLAGTLDDLRENFRRIQLVFDAEAPAAAFHAAGIERLYRKGRVLTVIASSGAERILEEARALQPSSIDVSTITLKEIFLETVSAEE